VSATHTPGKWRAVLSGDRQPHILYRGLICVLERSPDRWTSVVVDDDTGHSCADDIEANAKLIAAAPDLLAACEALVELEKPTAMALCSYCGKADCGPYCPVALARKALAKAKQ
jgi:hypothetical protein